MQFMMINCLYSTMDQRLLYNSYYNMYHEGDVALHVTITR